MTLQLGMVLALLAGAILMFARGRPRMDAVAIIMLVALPLTGALTVGEALAGFSDANVVLIAALFVIGDGLVRTGVARGIGDQLIRRGGTNETRLVALLMVAVCGLGSMMSSTAVTAIFIPVALRIASRVGAAPGKMLMPLSAAALISGMMTLVATTPNLVVNSELTRQGFEGFRFFSFTPFGVPILVLGIGYMLFARRWLPGAQEGDAGPGAPRLSDWIERYQVAGRERRLRVGAGSPIAGETVAAFEAREPRNASVIAIERAGRRSRTLLEANDNEEIRAGDVVIIDLPAPDAGLDERVRGLGLEDLPLAAADFADRTQDIGMAEVIVPADSPLIGKTLRGAGFRTKTGLTVIGMRHGGDAVEEGLLEERLRIGDTLLVVGPWKRIRRLGPDDSGVLIVRLPTEIEEALPVSGRALPAVLSLGLVVVLMVWGIIPNVQAALIGCLLMGAFGCINLASAYRAIDWKTIVLIVGMLPFSIALQRTGGVDIAADALTAATSGAGTYVILGALFLVTMTLGMFISNTATAVLMAPVAVSVAKELGAAPHPFAMIVALAASTAFITPVSSPVNTLVVSPGNYRFGDFVKVGAPFALVVMVVCVVMVPWLLPLYPAVETAPIELTPILEGTNR
ncbi:MAG: SLC13 family permease [Phycisphaerales bacterium]|nr:SLC13 family permease [Phycisphaerales bacterium]